MYYARLNKLKSLYFSVVFAPHVDELFDEDVLLNKGWTTRETLRPLAYSTLADFVHHIRQHLSMSTIVKAVQLYSLNVHDESLPTGYEYLNADMYVRNRLFAIEKEN